MARVTPTVRESALLFHGQDQAAAIPVGSEAWFSWLDADTSTIFSFYAASGSFTARKERAGNRRGGWYWKAYRKHQSKQYRAYLGQTPELTLERLDEIALMLSMRIQGQATSTPDMAPGKQHPAHQSYPLEVPQLQTKLQPPRLPASLIERAPLLALLDAGQQQKLTLIHAPAGFGKTTLVGQWLAHRKHLATASQRPAELIAWISLDSSDNDPMRFWSSVIAACQVFADHPGQRALAYLARDTRSPFAAASLQTALTLLLNDLGRSGSQGILVLEDYHLIEHERLHETLTFFIEHLPSCLHVMILTRSEPPLPLARWRSQGSLVEITSRQLRFSREESATFLRQTMPQAFSLSAAQQLDTYLEGWPAGMRLLTLSLQGYTTPQALDEALREFTRDTGDGSIHRSLQEFFLVEIFNAQPEPLQTFLLQTSRLRRLTGSLCDAVTGRQDSAEWLALIERSGFFLEALDTNGRWYRYYALWAATLRSEALRRLGPAALRALQAAASHWYDENAMPVEAIETALAAQEYALAARLIIQLNTHTYFPEYHTMQRWIEQLPPSLLQAQPELCFLLAQARLFAEDAGGPPWKIDAVEDLLLLAETGWKAEGQQLQLGILYALRATFTLVHGRIPQAAIYARQALQLLPVFHTERPYAQQPPEWIEWHCGCLMAVGLDMAAAGSFTQAYQFLLQGYKLSLHKEDRVFTRIMGWHLGDICYEMGKLHQAASFYGQMLNEAPDADAQGETILRGNALTGMAHLTYEWNDLERLEQLLHDPAFSLQSSQFAFGEAYVYMKRTILRLLLLCAQGESASAQIELDALLVRLQTLPYGLPLLLDVLIWQARWQIRESDLTGAENTLNTLASHMLSPLQQEARQLLDARLSLARGQAEAILPELLQLRAAAQERQHMTRQLEIDLLCALAYAASKQRQAAHQHLTQTLPYARKEGFLRLFLDEGEALASLLRSLLPTLTEKSLHVSAQNILQAFNTSTSELSTDTPLLEALSALERRVLTLLVAGRSNPEMAEALIVSVNTIKGHVKNLYRKLDVTSRREASEVARRLKLV